MACVKFQYSCRYWVFEDASFLGEHVEWLAGTHPARLLGRGFGRAGAYWSRGAGVISA